MPPPCSSWSEALGLGAGLVDVAERVVQEVRLDRRHHQAHLDVLPRPVAVAPAADLIERLGPLELVGDDREDSV
jgi:hypothetical protein